jgi:hypothetical protein
MTDELYFSRHVMNEAFVEVVVCSLLLAQVSHVPALLLGDGMTQDYELLKITFQTTMLKLCRHLKW